MVLNDRWSNGRIILINHRGLSPGYPENTLAAFRNSIALGVEVIELDLRGTKDRVPVVLHDPTVDRTTNGRGAIEVLTLPQVKALDAGSHVDSRFFGERVPTYEELLELVSGTPVNLLLDIKPGKFLAYDSVVRLTELHKAILKVIIGARTVEAVHHFRALNPNLRILGLIREANDIQPFVEAGAEIIRLWPEWIFADPSLLTHVHDLGKPAWVTANDAGREELLKLIRLGVNGILTDLPKLLADLTAAIEKGELQLQEQG